MAQFKFFQGVNRERRFTRTPIAHIPVPTYTASVNEYRRAFINGWRACEFGRNIYDCPHSGYDPVGIPLKREWEYGFTECYNTRQQNIITDEQCYLNGWEQAQQGHPLNENPWEFGSHQFNMWYIGWNDFVDNH